MNLSFLEPEEILSLKKELINHHSVFRCFWDLCTPSFSSNINTACVEFDKAGNLLRFLINPDFWKSKSINQKKFIICHECLHILRGHGLRSIGKINEQNNFAMDIVVNETLVKFFSFDKNEIDPKYEYIWFDKFFKNDKKVEKWRNFEYYANLFDEIPNKPDLVDHSYISQIPESFLKEILKNLDIDELEVLKNKFLDSLKNDDSINSINGGNQEGSMAKEIPFFKIEKKKKWESIIKKFEKSFSKDFAEEDCWSIKNRRNFFLDKNLFLPNEIEMQIKKSDSKKIATWFFLDSSGSCWSLSERFFKAAKSLDPTKFDVRFFCFDTKIYPLNLKENKIFGGGGTSFSIIANYVYKNNLQHKPFVWVLTDGFGDALQIPENQSKKWSWFITENGTSEYIPKSCKIYKLSDFE